MRFCKIVLLCYYLNFQRFLQYIFGKLDRVKFCLFFHLVLLRTYYFRGRSEKNYVNLDTFFNSNCDRVGGEDNIYFNIRWVCQGCLFFNILWTFYFALKRNQLGIVGFWNYFQYISTLHGNILGCTFGVLLSRFQWIFWILFFVMIKIEICEIICINWFLFWWTLSFKLLSKWCKIIFRKVILTKSERCNDF